MTLRAVTKYKETIYFLSDCIYQDSKDPGEWIIELKTIYSMAEI